MTAIYFYSDSSKNLPGIINPFLRRRINPLQWIRKPQILPFKLTKRMIREHLHSLHIGKSMDKIS